MVASYIYNMYIFHDVVLYSSVYKCDQFYIKGFHVFVAFLSVDSYIFVILTIIILLLFPQHKAILLLLIALIMKTMQLLCVSGVLHGGDTHQLQMKTKKCITAIVLKVHLAF